MLKTNPCCRGTHVWTHFRDALPAASKNWSRVACSLPPPDHWRFPSVFYIVRHQTQREETLGSALTQVKQTSSFTFVNFVKIVGKILQNILCHDLLLDNNHTVFNVHNLQQQSYEHHSPLRSHTAERAARQARPVHNTNKTTPTSFLFCKISAVYIMNNFTMTIYNDKPSILLWIASNKSLSTLATVHT